MRLHSYVVARDFGFAPNPFYGFCTLATCKPRIRGKAQIGDWVVGTGSKQVARDGKLVFAMVVTEVMTFEQYWNDVRFFEKRPNLCGSKKQAFGDNIYYHDGHGDWCQLNSHHSYSDGTANEHNVRNDTQADRVLISDDFVYWGGLGPDLPKKFRNYQGYDVYAGRGHKNSFPSALVDELTAWIRSLGDQGYCGEPLDWNKVP